MACWRATLTAFEPGVLGASGVPVLTALPVACSRVLVLTLEPDSLLLAVDKVLPLVMSAAVVRARAPSAVEARRAPSAPSATAVPELEPVMSPMVERLPSLRAATLLSAMEAVPEIEVTGRLKPLDIRELARSRLDGSVLPDAVCRNHSALG